MPRPCRQQAFVQPLPDAFPAPSNRTTPLPIPRRQQRPAASSLSVRSAALSAGVLACQHILGAQVSHHEHAVDHAKERKADSVKVHCSEHDREPSLPMHLALACTAHVAHLPAHPPQGTEFFCVGRLRVQGAEQECSKVLCQTSKSNTHVDYSKHTNKTNNNVRPKQAHPSATFAPDCAQPRQAASRCRRMRTAGTA